MMISGICRFVDPKNFIKNARITLIPRIGTIKEHEGCDEEDIIRNFVDEDEIGKRITKFYDLSKLEAQVKKAKIAFAGFFTNLP